MVVVLLAIPTGIIVAKSTREELKAGRKSFLTLMILSIFVAILSLLFKIIPDDKLLIIFSMLFIFIVSLISYKFSFRKRRK